MRAATVHAAMPPFAPPWVQDRLALTTDTTTPAEGSEACRKENDDMSRMLPNAPMIVVGEVLRWQCLIVTVTEPRALPNKLSQLPEMATSRPPVTIN